MENTSDSSSNGQKMDGLARWLGTSVVAAFFASLEHCSCVNVDAEGEEADDDDDDDEANDEPLVFTTFPSFYSATSTSSAVPPDQAIITPPTVEHLPV